MGSVKTERMMAKEELPALFRRLAEALEKGGDNEFPGIDDFEKLKFSVEKTHEGICLKTKIRPAVAFHTPIQPKQHPLPEDATAKPRYKELKKRMRTNFKLIFKVIHDGQVPPEEAVKAFLSDAGLMVTYPGYGDAYYATFTEVCNEFSEAYSARDMDRLNATVDALAFQESHCHARYG